MKKLILSAIALAAFSFGASAQVNHNVTVTIPTVMDIRFNSSVTQNTTFTFADGADLETENEITGAAGLQVRANKNWKVSVKAAAANFSPATTTGPNAGSTNMGCGIVSVRKAAGTYLALTTADQEIATGNKGGYGASGNSFNIDYKANPQFDYEPDTYTLNVIYTVSAQ
jgi:hypothetical protein